MEVDNLINRFNRRAQKVTAYADDISIIITGVCPSTLSSVMEHTLREISSGRMESDSISMQIRRTQLSSQKDPRWIPLKINEVRLTPKTRVRYLSTVLDSKLTWRANVEESHHCAMCIQEDVKLHVESLACSDALDLHIGCATNFDVWNPRLVKSLR